MVTAAAVAVNVAEVPETVTLAGTVRLAELLLRATAVEAEVVTVQVRLPAPVIVVGVQARAETMGSASRVTWGPVAVAARALPVTSEAAAFVNWMTVFAAVAVGARLTETCATTPSGITVSFMP